ncbi:hypothetical protein FOYG_08014 [Fusarium oxysporum NRRL 32931]|uniref:Uncharacterized protein n=1 Tax=Fusarium oxysporum NRRL 32931 TaxID=660029 RepID=W9IDF1_FUSOX|nr:hypothetical protein FOYG_08014 [Fusarium oxysporum NRRL 32931]
MGYLPRLFEPLTIRNPKIPTSPTALCFWRVGLRNQSPPLLCCCYKGMPRGKDIYQSRIYPSTKSGRVVSTYEPMNLKTAPKNLPPSATLCFCSRVRILLPFSIFAIDSSQRQCYLPNIFTPQQRAAKQYIPPVLRI